jgi:hypothetical protein
MRALFERAARLARRLQRIPLEVVVLGNRTRLAFPGLSKAARCAYCHADVSGEEPDLVACETCSTIAHEACWDELGRCPVMGCAGRSRERGRARS